METSSTPVSQSLQELDRLRLFVALCLDGLGAGTRATEMVNLMNRTAAVLKTPTKPQPSTQAVAELETFAVSEQKIGFPYLYSVAIIKLWSIMEGLVDEVVTDRIRKKLPTASSALTRIKGSLVEFMLAHEDERIDILVEKLKESTDAPLKKGCGRFEVLLDAVGLGGAVHEAPRRTLLELSAIRNAIIHRGGTADRRFRETCPWFDTDDEQLIVLTQSHYGRYALAVVWYIVEIDARITIADGQNVSIEQNAFQTEVLERLRKEPDDT